MFTCPYLDQYQYMYRAPRPSHIRVLHASPNAPAVDIYINNQKVISNLRYKAFSQYLSFPAGLYNIKVFPAGQSTNAVIDTNFQIAEGQIYTIAAIGLLPSISLLPILDNVKPAVPGRTHLRTVHLSPNAPAVDITQANGRKLFNNIQYKEITDYIIVKPGLYNLEANLTGTNTKALSIPRVVLRPNRYYTIYIVGLAGQSPPLQALIPLDGQSYIRI